MPQLDLLTFFYQISFTFLSFWLSFLLYRLWVLPELYVITKQRQIVGCLFQEIAKYIKLQFINIRVINLKSNSILNLIILILLYDLRIDFFFSFIFRNIFQKLFAILFFILFKELFF